jgi:hypothetical protein
VYSKHAVFTYYLEILSMTNAAYNLDIIIGDDASIVDSA